MIKSARYLAKEAAIPLLCVFLASLFIALQFFGAPTALGSLRSLAPAETSSPRSTIQGFREYTAKASQLLLDAYRENRAEPGFFWSSGVKEKVKEAEALLARAGRTLDLSHVPPVDLEHRRLESTLQLKEILDRVPLPKPEEIPDADANLANWNVPGTEIKLVRMPDGPRAGEYLFSGQTVDLLREFYELVRNEPDLNATGQDFYDFFSQSPGYLLPPRWFALIEALPPSFRSEVQGQAVWQWIGLFLVLVIAVAIVVGVRRIVRTHPRASRSIIGSVLVPAATAIAALFVAYMSDYQINITGALNDAIEGIAEGVAYLATVWGILRLSGSLATHLTFSKSESIDAHLARAAIRIGGIGVSLALLIYGAAYLGLPLAGLLAGLGVGGLAVALAAKPTLENFIGGLILYADRPVRVGDLCRFGSLEGRVQEIGIRSTRIRGLDRSLITIPNATFVNLNIINLTNRDRMPYKRTVVLRASDGTGIRQEVEGLTALVSQHPMIEPGTLEVRLREDQEEKPKAEIRGLIMTSKWEEFLRIQQDLDLMLRDAVSSPDSTGGVAAAAEEDGSARAVEKARAS